MLWSCLGYFASEGETEIPYSDGFSGKNVLEFPNEGKDLCTIHD